MSFRDDSAPDVVISHSGTEVSYKLVRDGDVVQWYPSFIDEVPTEQRTGPTAFSYNDAPRTISQVLAFEDWSDGAGFVDAAPGSHTASGYSYSRGVDASNGYLCLSPEQQLLTTGGDFAADGYYYSPTFGMYAWDGTLLYHLESGEWVLLYTAGAAITDLIEYGNSTDVYLFLALGDATDMVYSTDGFATSPTTVTSEKAAFFEVLGPTTVEPRLVSITTTGLCRRSVNPIATGNWSNADRIGHTGETTTAMVAVNDVLWIFKEEGYYTFDGTNVGEQVPVDQLTRDDNGKHAYVWINGHIYVNYGNRLLDIDPVNETTSALLAPAHPELNGTIVAITGDLRWLYVFLDNIDGNQYCLKVDPFTGVAHTFFYLADAVNGAAAVVPHHANSISTTNEVLVFNAVPGGESAGNAYVVLPRDGFKPWEDANCRFEEDGGVIYGPNVDAGAATFEKWLNGGRVIAESVSGARNIVLAYSLDNSSSFTSLVTAVEDGVTEERVTSEVTFNRLRYSITLSTGDDEHTPRGVAFTFDTTPNPPRHLAWRLVLDVGDQQRRHIGGEKRPVSYEQALQHLRQSVGSRVTYTDYFGDSYTAKVLNVAVNGVSRKPTGTGRHHASSTVEVVLAEIAQNLVISTPGIWGQSIWASDAQWSE